MPASVPASGDRRGGVILGDSLYLMQSAGSPRVSGETHKVDDLVSLFFGMKILSGSLFRITWEPKIPVGKTLGSQS